jgi:hypothetical protein
METEDSLPCSQEPATGPYPEPDATSPHVLTTCKTYSNVNFPSASGNVFKRVNDYRAASCSFHTLQFTGNCGAK